jgi:hypothetical protein
MATKGCDPALERERERERERDTFLLRKRRKNSERDVSDIRWERVACIWWHVK